MACLYVFGESVENTSELSWFYFGDKNLDSVFDCLDGVFNYSLDLYQMF